jgi:hypothetical protein
MPGGTDHTHPLISKAIKHYRYAEPVNAEKSLDDFKRKYKNFTDKDTLKKHTQTIFAVLNGNPDATHIAAKKLLFQRNADCWKYFERSAVFWTFSHTNDEWLDHMKGMFDYALFVERDDLLARLIQKTQDYLSLDVYEDIDHQQQQVYPSTQFIHFLVEKWLGANPVKESVLQYGAGYGIYQQIIDHWGDLSHLPPDYWNELCEYHLNGLGLQGTGYKYEEFLAEGLVPMELQNLLKVRNKQGLDLPRINHPLFNTPMAAKPVLPTGYSESTDAEFQLVWRTVKDKKAYTYEQVLKDVENEQSGLAVME